jgi:UDP-N-acetylmuramate dehydrogenase
MCKHYSINSVIKTLVDFSIDFKRDVDLSDFTYFKTGGVAKLVIFPCSIDELQNILTKLNANFVRYKVVGETTNLMFLDNKVYSCIVSVRNISNLFYDVSEHKIVAECGALLSNLSRLALLHGYGGFSGLEGIPGSVGAAVVMNAGAYGNDIAGVLLAVDVLDLEGNIVRLSSEDLELKYRDSIFRRSTNDYIILRAYFKCCLESKKDIYKKMTLFHAKRHKYQEFAYPTLGSLFSGSIYRSLAKKNFLFGLVSSTFFLFNYRFKLHRRESPMERIWLNNLAVKIFKIECNHQSFSDKDLNTLINQGQGTDEMISYINTMKKLLGDGVPIENEIVENF